MVDPPVQPLRPASPNRPLLAAGVFMAAMGCGVVLCYLLSLLRPVFLRVEDLRKTFVGFKVLGGIEMIHSPRETPDTGVDFCCSARSPAHWW